MNTVRFGIRDLDEREKAIVRDSAVIAITMTAIDREGIGATAERALTVTTAGTLASTSAWTWTASTQPSRPVSARRFRAA